MHIAGFEKYELVALCSSTFCQAGVIVSIVKVSHTGYKKKEKILTSQIFSSLSASEFPVLQYPPTGITGLAVTILHFLRF